MSLVRVKICGITRVKDALDAVDMGADALGFNFWPKSKRFCHPRIAEEVVQRLPPMVTAVGVFVNQPRIEILRVIKKTRVNAVQLHGDESPRVCGGYDLPVIKALQVPRDLERIKAYWVGALLLDTASAGYGGTGRAFDWSLVRKLKTRCPVILAGGLNPQNVRRAIRAVSPFAVDVASGVERAPGIKDSKKMASFIANAKKERL